MHEAPSPRDIRRTSRGLLLEILPPACLILAIAAWNWGFILRDHAHYAGVDDADSYMDYAGIYAKRFSDGLNGDDFRRIGFPVYSQLNFVLGGLAMGLFEPSPRTLRLYSASYLPLALIYIYLLGRLLFGRWGGLLAVFFGGLNLQSLAASRYFTLDAPLVLPMAAGIYHAVRSRGFTHPWHAAAALGFAAFGVAIKLAAGVQLFPAYALAAICGLAVIARDKQWKRLGAAFAVQGGIAAGVIALAFIINPRIFTYLGFDAGSRPAQSGFQFPLPYNAEGSFPIRELASWMLGYLRALRRISWPLAALAAVGAGAGLALLRPAPRKVVFLAVLLTPLTTNFLYVWVNAHYDLERYMGPSFIFLGIPVVASTLLAPRGRIRHAALALLTVYGIIGWAGPRLWPATFDTRRFSVFPNLRIEGDWLRSGREGQSPLLQFKLWSEPAPRPDPSRSAEILIETLRESVAGKEIAAPLKVACVSSDYWEDDSFYEYARLPREGDPFEFVFASDPSALLDADYIVLLSSNYAPGYTHVLNAVNYRDMMGALESESFRDRLRCREILKMGLRRGEALRLFERSRPATESQALEDAVAWHEATVFHLAARVNATQIASWVEKTGFPEAGASIAALATMQPDRPSTNTALTAFPDDACPGYARMKLWLADAGGVATRPAFEKIIEEGLPRGPGLTLSIAVEAMRWNEKAMARDLFLHNMREFPSHLETWTTALALMPQEPDIPQEFASDGRTLARLYDRAARIDSYTARVEYLRTALRLAQQDCPAIWDREMERLALLQRDQPTALDAHLQYAAVLEAKGEYGEEMLRALRKAYAQNGVESVDYGLHYAAGRCLLALGDIKGAERHLRQGGWRGIETWLTWRRLHRDSKSHRKALSYAAKKVFAEQIEGSDAVRHEIISALAQDSSRLAARAFADINQSSLSLSWGLFSQIASLESGASAAERMKDLREALERRRVNFYSATRPDFFALAAREAETGTHVRSDWEAGPFTPEEVRFRLGVERGRAAFSELSPTTAIAELLPGEQQTVATASLSAGVGVIYAHLRFLCPTAAKPAELTAILEVEDIMGVWRPVERIPLLCAPGERIALEIVGEWPRNSVRCRLAIARQAPPPWMAGLSSVTGRDERWRLAITDLGLLALERE